MTVKNEHYLQPLEVRYIICCRARLSQIGHHWLLADGGWLGRFIRASKWIISSRLEVSHAPHGGSDVAVGHTSLQPAI
jgi:hypothetical protein